MTPNQFIGYLDGYMCKHALLGDVASAGLDASKAVAGGAVDVAETLTPWIMAAPILVGGAAGLAHSKMTSPSNMDMDTAEKAILLAEAEEYATEIARRRLEDKKEEQRKAKKKESGGARTIRI